MPKQEGNAVDLEEWLYRRSYCDPLRKYLNPDGTAHSRVFKPRLKDMGYLSVDVRSMTSIQQAIKDSQTFILFELSCSDAESIGLSATHDPLEDNPAHALLGFIDDEDEIIPGLLARKARLVKTL